MNRESGSVIILAQSKGIGARVYQLALLYWYNTTQVEILDIAYKDTDLVKVVGTNITGIASGYYIDLSVIGYNDKY